MVKKKIVPKNGMVLVQYLVKSRYTKTSGGIIIPIPAQQGRDEGAQVARVLATAEGVTSCKAGDEVYVFLNDGMMIESLYRARHKPDEGVLKLYKAEAILAIREPVSIEDTGNGSDIVETHDISDLETIKQEVDDAMIAKAAAEKMGERLKLS